VDRGEDSPARTASRRRRGIGQRAVTPSPSARRSRAGALNSWPRRPVSTEIPRLDASSVRLARGRQAGRVPAGEGDGEVRSGARRRRRRGSRRGASAPASEQVGARGCRPGTRVPGRSTSQASPAPCTAAVRARPWCGGVGRLDEAPARPGEERGLPTLGRPTRATTGRGVDRHGVNRRHGHRRPARSRRGRRRPWTARSGSGRALDEGPPSGVRVTTTMLPGRSPSCSARPGPAGDVDDDRGSPMGTRTSRTRGCDGTGRHRHPGKVGNIKAACQQGQVSLSCVTRVPDGPVGPGHHPDLGTTRRICQTGPGPPGRGAARGRLGRAGPVGPPATPKPA
jgi:hypothetical protein